MAFVEVRVETTSRARLKLGLLLSRLALQLGDLLRQAIALPEEENCCQERTPPLRARASASTTSSAKVSSTRAVPAQSPS